MRHLTRFVPSPPPPAHSGHCPTCPAGRPRDPMRSPSSLSRSHLSAAPTPAPGGGHAVHRQGLPVRWRHADAHRERQTHVSGRLLRRPGLPKAARLDRIARRAERHGDDIWRSVRSGKPTSGLINRRAELFSWRAFPRISRSMRCQRRSSCKQPRSSAGPLWCSENLSRHLYCRMPLKDPH